MSVLIVGSTAICSITVNKKSDGSLTDPATSMNVEVYCTRPTYSAVISAVAMEKDSTGTYHYDFQTVDRARGDYRVEYIATDGTRISKGSEEFEVT